MCQIITKRKKKLVSSTDKSVKTRPHEISMKLLRQSDVTRLDFLQVKHCALGFFNFCFQIFELDFVANLFL